MDKRRELHGDHNQCPSCGQYFNSTFAFDKHRVGDFSPKVTRRCMTLEEMEACGMALNAGGWWISQKAPEGHFQPDSVATASPGQDSGPL